MLLGGFLARTFLRQKTVKAKMDGLKTCRNFLSLIQLFKYIKGLRVINKENIRPYNNKLHTYLHRDRPMVKELAHNKIM